MTGIDATGSAAAAAAAPAVAPAATAAVPPFPVLHAVTDDATIARGDFAERARAVMAAGGGRVAVHLRSRSLPTRSLFILAELLGEAQRATGAWVVVNDRLDVALLSGVRGVQLPSHSFTVADAQRVAAGRRLRLGVSVHDAVSAARAAAAGADWLVAGHVHATPSHTGLPGRGEGFVREIVAAARGVPVIAIGGVTPARTPALHRAGAAGVAAIRGLWDAGDASGVVAEYLSAYDDGRPRALDAHGQR